MQKFWSDLAHKYRDFIFFSVAGMIILSIFLFIVGTFTAWVAEDNARDVTYKCTHQQSQLVVETIKTCLEETAAGMASCSYHAKKTHCTEVITERRDD